MTQAETISHEEQLALAREYRRSGDRRIEQRLVRGLLRLVVKMAKQLGRRRDHDDLVQEGCLGVVHAIRHFDPERGVRLTTYAAWWIRAYQLRWLVSNHRLVRVGKTALQRRVFFQGRALRRRLQSAGFDPTPEELARRLGVDAEKFALDLRSIEAREVNIEDQVIRLDNSVEDRLAGAEAGKRVAEELVRFVGSLDRRDRTIVKARWLKESPLSLSEMGQRLGISRERVRQLEERLLEKMRERLPADLAA